MSQGRILPLVGPALVLYSIAEVAGSRVAFDATAFAICCVALLLSALPLFFLRRKDALLGARRAAAMGVLAGVALVRFARPELPSLYLDLASALATPALGVLVVSLAVTAPDRWDALAKRRWIFTLVVIGAIAAAAISSLSYAPAFEIGSATILIPVHFWLAGPAFTLLMLAFALVARVARRRIGSTPEALAAGLWAQLGLWFALAMALVLIALVLGDGELSSVPARALIGAGVSALVAGHVGMIGARERRHAGRSTRIVLAAALALGSIAALTAQLAGSLPHDPFALGVVAALAAIVAALVFRVASAAFDRWLAPFGGALLRGASEAIDGLADATTIDELGSALLPPLRRAAGTLEAEPLLWTIDPPRTVRVDAAGVAHVDDSEPSPAILARVLDRPGEIVVSAPLVEQVVRRADLRPLVDALERFDALCVVPLSVRSEVEGVLVVPRGRRRGALTLEEIDRLEQLGRQTAARVALLCAEERSRRRTRDAMAGRAKLEDERDAVMEEVASLRAEASALRSGHAKERFTQPPIAYSAAMRRLVKRVNEVSPLDAPVLLIGEEGTALDAIGSLLHGAKGGEGPFVVADCASVRPERTEAALFGEGEGSQRGWLRLAEGGTCFLMDVPALSLSAQAKLAEAIATRRAHPADGSAAYPVDARVVATSRVDLAHLASIGAFDLELFRRFEPLVLRVPPLRERKEDVPSLVLLALDRSCRSAGRPVVGIDPEALGVLIAHDWPGNMRELTSVIDRAIERAAGPTVRLADLPPLAPAEAEPIVDPWTGTYAELEARILVHAMEQANGNKSEAARALGLKRTTFLDKLKRHDLLGPEDKKPEDKQGTAA